MLFYLELCEKVIIVVDLLDCVKVMCIILLYGMDVIYKLNIYEMVVEYVCIDMFGCWDYWFLGFVFMGGDDDGVDGQIVVVFGDILLLQNLMVCELIIYIIEKGWIIDICGGLEVQIVKEYMVVFNDKCGFGMSYVGWGMNLNVKWYNFVFGIFEGGMGMELCSFYGNVMFLIGLNNELGGLNDIVCYLDILMCGCLLFFDDEVVVIDGDVVVKDIQMSCN